MHSFKYDPVQHDPITDWRGVIELLQLVGRILSQSWNVSLYIFERLVML